MQMIEVRSAAEAREIEKKLAIQGVSYQTRIVKTRKKGLVYVIYVFGAAYDGIGAADGIGN
jgi:hypothetical protein